MQLNSDIKGKASAVNPTLKFDSMGNGKGYTELRKSGNAPQTLSLVFTDDSGDKIFHTLINADGSRGWVVQSELTALKNSFQAGVDVLFNKCKSRGATPSAKTPTAIASAIDKIYTDRYNAGKAEITDLGVISASSQSGSNTRDSTFKLTKYPNYKNIGTSNIIFMPVTWKNGGGTDKDMDSFWGPQIKSYDKNTGTVTLRGASGTNYGWGASVASARFIIVT